MILTITDEGDPSVGIFSQNWNIECPFNKDDVDQQNLEWFRFTISKAYGPFCEGKLIAMYDFEFEQFEEEY